MKRSARQPIRRETAPWPLAVPAAVGVTFLLVPLAAMLLRTPWSSLPDILRDPAVLDALRLSLVTATSSTAVAVVLGVPLAWVVGRTNLSGVSLMRAMVTVTLVL